ncbi:MAG: hypothetical protein A4E58_02549 [Syntrophorhabdus sp. PtaB.Bin006]|nr:MAG: hypothetical protein A4E58_02549 [Syntrophorhabdus sp. PtaB.Bin006]
MTGQAGGLARERDSRRNAIISEVRARFTGCGKKRTPRGRERKSIPATNAFEQ